MLPPIPLPEDHSVSLRNGFLPSEIPLDFLPDPYYGKWESVISNLQALLLSKRLRGILDRMPVLSTSRLQGISEWRRAYHILTFMANGYIWGGDKPAEVCSLDLVQLIQYVLTGS